MLVVKNLLASVGDTSNPAGSLDQEDLLEEGVATHFSILAWRIPMDRGPGQLQSMGSQTEQLSTVLILP